MIMAQASIMPSHSFPYIRRRMITETEVLAAALRAHGAEAAEKFIGARVPKAFVLIFVFPSLIDSSLAPRLLITVLSHQEV